MFRPKLTSKNDNFFLSKDLGNFMDRLANQRPVLLSPDLSQPIRGQYYCHLTYNSQSEASITVT